MDVKGFFGGLLVTIGSLFAVLAGGCGCFFLVAVAPEAAQTMEHAVMWFVVLLIFSAVPCVFGIGVAYSGRLLLSSSRESSQSNIDTDE